MIIKYEMTDLPNPVVTNEESFGGSYAEKITSVAATKDGGYIAGGSFGGSSIQVGNETLTNNGGRYTDDGLLIKYDADGEMEWAKSFGGGSTDTITSITETKDGGILVGGNFYSDTIQVGNFTLTNRGAFGGTDGFIIKYDVEGEVEWAKSFGGSSYDYIYSVAATSDGGYIAGGSFRSSSIQVGNEILTNNGSSANSDGLIIKYDVEGEVEWAESFGGSGSDTIYSVAVTSDEGIIAGGYFYETVQVGNGILTSNGGYDGLIIKYNGSGEVEWAKSFGGSDDDYINSVAETSDGGYIAGGYFYSDTIQVGNETLTSNGDYDGLIIKYDSEGGVEWAKNIGGSSHDYIYSVASTSDGGYITGGYFISRSIQVENEVIKNNYTGTNLTSDGLIIKYNANGRVEWTKSFGGNDDDSIDSVLETRNGKVIAGGYFSSDTIEENGHTLENQGDSDGMILEIVNQVGVPEVQELTVENSRKQFKITTDVNEANGTRGGSITGEDETPYETVKYGDNSTKQIVMTPDENYEIIGITVNGEEWQFTANADGTYTMPQFTNMTEDKHIVVTYALKSNKITINKVDSADNSKKLEGAIFEIKSEDGTTIKLTTNSQGQAITQLEYGNYTITEIQAPEGYELNSTPLEISFTENETHEFTIQNNKKAKVIVHHYLKNEDGTYTEIKVAEDELLEEKPGESYTTNPKLDLEKYELERDTQGNYVLPDNATGTYEAEKTIEVIYYYEIKEIPLIVHHYIEGTEDKVPLKDGGVAEDVIDSGKEGEEYTTTAVEESKLAEDYELVETPSNASGTYTAPEVEVTYYYKKVVRDVILNKYDKDGKTSIEGVEFSIASKETPEEEIGRYTTNEKGQIKVTLEVGEYIAIETKVAEGYVMPEDNTTEFVVTKTDNEVTLNITNEKVEGNVIAKYLEEGTEKELSGQLEQTGKVGTTYTTTQKEITGYDFVRVEGEATGKYIEGTIEVIYYYTLKDPIIDDEIEKTSSTLEITDKDQAIPYTIEYNATITDYRGNATVTIVDYLPYEIDEGLSNISGGTYNRIEKTITWTQEITEIDTYEEETTSETAEDSAKDLKAAKEINITKEIELVYVNMDVTQEAVENRVTGTIKLDTPEKEETTEENEIIPTNFKIEVPVEKVWNDNEDTKGRRPESVTIQLTADGSEELNGEKLESVVLNEENNWKYTFENLAKYTEYGREIVYSVVEKETNEGDLEYYKEPVIENIGETNELIRVTNSYNLMETDLTSSIEKTGTEKITSSKDKVSYSIKYKAEITDYIGEAVVTIVDYLPYHIDEEAEGTDLDGGIYDEDANTITWTVNIDHINTTTDGAYKVDETRDITVVFSDLDASQKVMVNRVKGTIDLYETEQTNEVEDTYETEIEIPGKVIVKYVDKETGEEIPFREQDTNNPEAETPEGGISAEGTYGYEINGKVGDEYSTKQKEIYGYTYVENSGNAEGNMTEKDIIVTYYYEKTEAGKVTAIYIDEATGEEITYIEENEETGETEEKTYKEEIEGYIGDEYHTEQKEIPNYDFVRVEGEPDGELTEEEKTVVYIYKKVPAKVIVRYLEKDNTPEDDSDNKVLAEEDVINGYSGDEYDTERKDIEYYKAADPEPENAEGTMTRETIYVTYYYEKIPSGTVTAIYVDEATGKEITYIEENKETGKTEEKTYKETYKGYCGDEYKTEAKEIPYYEYVEEKAPTNATGIYTEEDVLVTYYYRQLPFNMAVDKNLTKIELNGEEQKVIDGKINKVEIPVDRVADSTLKLEYSIVVTNTGKVEGTTEVIESLPKYFKVTEGTSKEWKKQKDGTLKLVTKEIQAGESKEYKVVLEWERGENNFGTLENTVELTNVENQANFTETTLEDNKSKAELVLAVKSGMDRSMRWVGSTIGILLILAGMVVYVRRKI